MYVGDRGGKGGGRGDRVIIGRGGGGRTRARASSMTVVGHPSATTFGGGKRRDARARARAIFDGNVCVCGGGRRDRSGGVVDRGGISDRGIRVFPLVASSCYDA